MHSRFHVQSSSPREIRRVENPVANRSISWHAFPCPSDFQGGNWNRNQELDCLKLAGFFFCVKEVQIRRVYVRFTHRCAWSRTDLHLRLWGTRQPKCRFQKCRKLARPGKGLNEDNELAGDTRNVKIVFELSQANHVTRVRACSGLLHM